MWYHLGISKLRIFKPTYGVKEFFPTSASFPMCVMATLEAGGNHIEKAGVVYGETCTVFDQGYGRVFMSIGV